MGASFACTVATGLVLLAVTPKAAFGHEHSHHHERRHRHPGAHVHDGFFLRLSAGIGGVSQSSLTRDSGTVEAAEAQPATLVDVAVGAIIARNLALHFSVFGVIPNRRSELLPPPGGALSRQKSISGFGVGITKYFMPLNLFVTAAVGGAVMTVETLGVEEDIPGGLGLFFGIGKEWWVSENWGIGVLGQVAYARISDPVGVWNTAWGGIAFCATYN